MMLRDTNGCRERSSNSSAIDLNKCAPEFINHHLDLNALSPPPLSLPLSLSLPLPLLSPPPPLFSPPPPSPPPNNNGPNFLELRAMTPTTGYIVPSATFWFPQVQPSFTLVTPDLIPSLHSSLSGHNTIAIFEGGGVPSPNPLYQGASAGLKEVATASKLFPEFPSTQRCGEVVDRNLSSSSSSSSFHRSFPTEELATGSYSHSHSHSYISQGSVGGVPLQMDRILEQYRRRQEAEAKPPLFPYFLTHARTEEADGNRIWHANGNIPSSSSSAAISSQPTPNLYKDFLMTEPSNNGAVTKDFLGQRRIDECKRRGGSRGFSLQEEGEEDEKEKEREKEKENEEEANGQGFFLNRHVKNFPPSQGSKRKPFIVGEADTRMFGDEMASVEDWSSGLFRDDRSVKNEEVVENGWDQENMTIARTKLFQGASPEELENYHQGAFELSSSLMLDGEKEPGGGFEPHIRVIESPSWLPPGWITILKTRKSGSTAGTTDKYYKDPDTGRTFRSRNEVLQFLDTGRFTRNKSKTEWGDECSPSDLPYWLVDIPRDGHSGKAQQSNHNDLFGANSPSIGNLCAEGSSQIQIARYVDRGDATQNPHMEYLFLMPNNVNASGNICTEDLFSKAKNNSCNSAFEEQGNHHQIKLLQEYNAQPYNMPFNLLPPIGHTNTLLRQPFERLDERLLYFRNAPKPVSYSLANVKESPGIYGSYGKPPCGPVHQGKRPLVIPQGIRKQPKLNPKYEKELLVVLGRKLCLQTLGRAT